MYSPICNFAHDADVGTWSRFRLFDRMTDLSSDGPSHFSQSDLLLSGSALRQLHKQFLRCAAPLVKVIPSFIVLYKYATAMHVKSYCSKQTAQHCTGPTGLAGLAALTCISGLVGLLTDRAPGRCPTAPGPSHCHGLLPCGGRCPDGTCWQDKIE